MGLFSSVVSTIGGIAGNLIDRNEQRNSAKKQYKYNSWLQSDNQEFQKYMAENAHQLEMSDLQKAGLNPALTATGSSAGAIAGSSSAQGTSAGNATSNFSEMVNILNSTRATNANNALLDAQTLKTLTENKQLPAELKNRTVTALSQRLNANANVSNAKTNKYNAETNRGRAEWQNARDKSAIHTEKGGRIAKELGNFYWDL